MSPEAARRRGELTVALGLALLLLAVPWLARLAWPWLGPGAQLLGERALMVTLAAFLVFTGNALPKHLPALAGPAEARHQLVRRLAGWTWVLAGLSLGLAWAFLPVRWAEPVTFTVLPAALLVVAACWALLRGEQAR